MATYLSKNLKSGPIICMFIIVSVIYIIICILFVDFGKL